MNLVLLDVTTAVNLNKKLFSTKQGVKHLTYNAMMRNKNMNQMEAGYFIHSMVTQQIPQEQGCNTASPRSLFVSM